ncbi:hypothetical protein P692DRAFT_20753932, partial [Suillus brevipes Sb2]
TTNVPILSEHNYPTWKIRIRKLQREKDWGTVSGEDPDPSALQASTTSPAAPGTASASTSTTIPSTISSATSVPSDTWKIRNDKALGIIIEYVSNEKLDLIADQTSAKAAWEKLEKHIATFSADNRKLTAMGKAIRDEMQAFLVLTSLPSTPIWDTFTTSLLQSLPANSSLIFEIASTRLLSQSLLINANSSEPSSALVTDARTNGASSQGQYCEYHESQGHATKDCRDLKEMKKERKPREREKSGSKTKTNKAVTDSDSKARHAHTKHRRNNSQRVYVTKALMNRVQLYTSTTAAATNTTR